MEEDDADSDRTRFRPLSLRHEQIRRSHEATQDHLRRVARIEEQKDRSTWYPRLREQPTALKHINQKYSYLEKSQTEEKSYTVVGRINVIRTAGSKLSFIDIIQDGELQIVLRHKGEFSKIARKGDIYKFSGSPHRTPNGQLSLLVLEAPELLAPCLHQIPDSSSDLSHHRYVQMLMDPESVETLKIRHAVEKSIESFLDEKGFVKVSTPIIQAGAGGAVARPFTTEATEMQGRQLDLRIAPELWLKRLVVGGLSRVYEIGPVFRNEGIDATHNPEFTICEFYAAYATLDGLMAWTEEMVRKMAEATKYEIGQFQQLEFIPTIEDKIGRLPDLSAPDATEKVKEIFSREKIELPAKPSLPRLLDALAAHYIEPLCEQPTFITYHPAVMSPLSKHFERDGQIVSARAELFIKQREIANMYEEQNSPYEQEKAFVEQLKYRDVDGEGTAHVDHAYVEALQWALPPTGGWGCGVDRLVMLFSGKERLADVLPFGGLRHVVNVGKGR